MLVYKSFTSKFDISSRINLFNVGEYYLFDNLYCNKCKLLGVYNESKCKNFNINNVSARACC